MQILLDHLLAGSRRPIELVAKVDNTQCILAVQRGYSKKLRFLERTRKSSIGAVHELINSGDLVGEYAPTLTHRGDGFTTALTPVKFLAAREMMGLVRKKL